MNNTVKKLMDMVENCRIANGGEDYWLRKKALEAALTKLFVSPAEPAAVPVKGLFVDLIAQYPGLAEELAAIVIDAPPSEPARTSQDVCTVPLLRDEEILQLTPLCFKKYTDGVLLGHARAIEQLVRRKAGL